MSSVTGLQFISSLYRKDITFINAEHSANNRTVQPFTTVNVGNAWIPWCDSKEQFDAHHMRIQVENKVFYVWQSGSSIRCSSEGWNPEAKSIIGNSGVGQSVIWILSLDSVLIQTSYR